MTTEELETKWGISPVCGCEIGPGWTPIVDRLFTGLTELGFDVKSVAQIKEKFGGLRVYFDVGLTDEQEGLLQAAENEAAVTCEDCGKPGKLRTGGWWMTRCDEHVRAG